MLARRITRPTGWPAGMAGHREEPHRVVAGDEDFIARCGERWSRKVDGEVLPDHYNGEVCKPCG